MVPFAPGLAAYSGMKQETFYQNTGTGYFSRAAVSVGNPVSVIQCLTFKTAFSDISLCWGISFLGTSEFLRSITVL